MLFIEKDTQFNEFLNDNKEAVFFDGIEDSSRKNKSL